MNFTRSDVRLKTSSTYRFGYHGKHIKRDLLQNWKTRCLILHALSNISSISRLGFKSPVKKIKSGRSSETNTLIDQKLDFMAQARSLMVTVLIHEISDPHVGLLILQRGLQNMCVKWIKFGTLSLEVIEITEVHYGTAQLLS